MLIVDDIIITKETFMGRNKYFMMSESREKYIKLNQSQYDFYNLILPWFYENIEEDEIEDRLRDHTKEKVSLKNILKVFYDNNLLKEKVEEIKGKVEIDLSSKKVCEIFLDKFQTKHNKLLHYIGISYFGVAFLILGVTTLLFIFGFSYISEVFTNSTSLEWKEIEDTNIILIILGILLSVPGHEFGHLLLSNHYGMKWKSFNFSLRWGISFVFYIKYYNFYAFPSVKRIKILLAGIYMNLVQACLWFLLFIFLQDIKLLIIVTINLFSIISNILPKGTSDGYHILCILTGLEGIRWRMIKLISTIIKKPKTLSALIKEKVNVILINYFIISYSISLFACYSLLKSAFRYLNMLDNELVSMFCFSILAILVISSVLINVTKFINNLKLI